MSCSLGEGDAASACPANLQRVFSCSLTLSRVQLGATQWQLPGSRTGAGKNNNPSAPARKGNYANSQGCCWGREKDSPVYKSLSLRWVLTATLLPCTPHPLHPASHFQPPARDDDIPLCPLNSQTRQPHTSSCGLCLRCHIFIKTMLICTACTSVHICAHLLICSVCPHLCFQQLSLVIPFFMLPRSLVAVV